MRRTCARCKQLFSPSATDARLCPACQTQPPPEPAAGPPAPPPLDERRPPTDLVGKRVGEYLLVEQIGAGGMGEVYRGLHETHGQVAIKLFRPGSRLVSSAARFDELRARFQREANIGTTVDHPGLIKVLALDSSDRGLYIAMEYVEGTPLQELLEAQGPQPFERALTLTRGVALALEAAHQQGVIHRDIKPGNILVDRAGEPRVLDFGLAGLLADSDKLTGTNQIVGTPSHMAPEQILPDGHIDGRTDVFALGVTLFEMLTLERPFPGKHVVDVLERVLHSEPPTVGSARARVVGRAEAIPIGLDSLVARMMAKRPDERPQSMAQVVDELDEILDDLADMD